MKSGLIIILALSLMNQQTSFKETQLGHARVNIAFDEKENTVKELFAGKKLSYDKFQMFLRAFKKEQKLEVWVKEKDKTPFVLLHTYDFCTTSGTLGPKRKQGDAQIPEGVYSINHFNPLSNYFLSLGLNYPNASDKILSDKDHPGGSIYIHGGCATIGCIPIMDEGIKSLYVMAVEARNSGQEKIPVHVFPARLDLGAVENLVREYQASPEVASLWKNLQTIYLDFKTTSTLKQVKVNSKGEYHF